MTPPLTSAGLTERRPVCAVTALVTEVTQCSQPQVSTGMEFGCHGIHIKLQLFQPYQSPESAVKYT